MYNHADKINGPALIGVQDLFPVVMINIIFTMLTTCYFMAIIYLVLIF